MRNYVIINGVNSLTIPGLAIKSLPPITKPLQRTLREEIDGRDGDIITELGYGAYDKEIEIGLFGDFDVDQIIAYFNQKGTITFSNEPDKVYYFQALNQVDYEELIKFREAGVELHCQPFKYPLTEEPLIEEYEYVTGSGETITLDNTEETTFNEIELQGNTEQFQTTGKNLLELTDAPITKNGVTFTPNADGSVSITGTSTGGINQQIINANNPPIIEAGTYTRSVKTVGTITKNSTSVLLTGRNSANDNIMGDLGINENATTTRTTTTTGTNTMSNIAIYISAAGAVFDCTLYIQLEKSATATDWEPYTGGNPAPNPDYPEDIHVVSGNNEIIITGTNLFSSEMETGGINNTTGQPEGNNNCIRTIDFIKVKPSTTYSIGNDKNYNLLIYEYDKNKNFIQYTGNFNNPKTWGTQPTTEFIKIRTGAASVQTDLTTKYMMNIGSTLKPYESYTEDTYPINLPVENKFDIETATEGKYLDASGNLKNTANSDTSDFIEIEANKPYTLSYKFTLPFNSQAQREIVLYNTSKTFIKTITLFPIGSGGKTFIPDQAGYIRFDYDKKCYDIQLEPGVNKNSYTPYGTESIEMAELPETDYHDTFIRGNDEKWYKEENIKKVIYKGSSGEAWTYYQGIVYIDDTDIKDLGLTNNTFLLSNYFTAGTGRFYIAHTTRQRIHINLNAVGLSDITNVTQWKEWLGTHNLEILFVRNENLIEITGDLADQLEALWQATSKRGQTNITQTNNDLPFFMIVSAMELGSDVITIPDGGNIYSKPKIKLEGTGIVDIYLNDVQEFEVDLTEDNEITIDTEKMEAYTETGLANRKVTGDYSKFKLQPGDNEIRFSGDLTKATITRYMRWL